MTPAQNAALARLVGRALTAAEVVALAPLVDARDDVAIAALLSIGRTRIVTRQITARGVRAGLTIVDAVRFLTLLRDTAAADAVPAWLAGVLTAAGVPESDHAAYLDTFACAHGWLQQEAGIDLGAATTRAMLDLIAASDPARFGSTVATLKALAVVDDPIPFDRVSVVLNKLISGLMTL